MNPAADSQNVQVGDVVQTRKPHPCGTNQWKIYRIGADIGMECLGCGRRVLLPRREFGKAVKKFIRRAEDDLPTPVSDPNH
ncbi:MAG: hypothetical protein OHK0023_05380 [Anaerolineae bacterium]